MIVRVTSAQLRSLARQVDAYTAIADAGGRIEDYRVPLSVDGHPIAYLHWWEDEGKFMCEFLDFKPGAGGS